MELIEEIVTAKGGKLQLLQGDLTDIPDDHKVDVLVISAYPNDYSPTQWSLIGELNRVGLSIKTLADNKEADFRIPFHCWFSKEINFINIKRVLCFEPADQENPYSLIAGIFQSLMSFTLKYPIQSVAMPLILAGDRGKSDEKVFKELISTSLFWLDKDFPVKTIKIVIKDHSQIEKLHQLFSAQQPLYLQENLQDKYNFFISYSRVNASLARIIHEKLQHKFRVFFDTESIDLGTNWVNKLNTSLKNSERFIVCISTDYLESKPCTYEFSYFNLVLINKGDDYILPLYLYSAELSFPLDILNYHDAREGQANKIEEFCEKIIKKYTN